MSGQAMLSGGGGSTDDDGGRQSWSDLMDDEPDANVGSNEGGYSPPSSSSSSSSSSSDPEPRQTWSDLREEHPDANVGSVEGGTSPSSLGSSVDTDVTGTIGDDQHIVIDYRSDDDPDPEPEPDPVDYEDALGDGGARGVLDRWRESQAAESDDDDDDRQSWSDLEEDEPDANVSSNEGGTDADTDSSDNNDNNMSDTDSNLGSWADDDDVEVTGDSYGDFDAGGMEGVDGEVTYTIDQYGEAYIGEDDDGNEQLMAPDGFELDEDQHDALMENLAAGQGGIPEDAAADMDELLAEQRAAYEAQIAALMESLPIPDQLGGSSDGSGLTPALGLVALLALGGGVVVMQS